jgi:hypothetical protein
MKAALALSTATYEINAVCYYLDSWVPIELDINETRIHSQY